MSRPITTSPCASSTTIAQRDALETSTARQSERLVRSDHQHALCVQIARLHRRAPRSAGAPLRRCAKPRTTRIAADDQGLAQVEWLSHPSSTCDLRAAYWLTIRNLTTELVSASDAYLEGALLIALFSVVSSSAMAKFLLRGEVIE